MAEFIQQHQAPPQGHLSLKSSCGECLESCIFQVFSPSLDSWKTTWRSVGSANSFFSAFLGCGKPCAKILGRCQGTWRLLMKKKRKQQEMTVKTTAWDPKLFEESKHLSKWKLGRKQQRSLLNEGPRHHEASPLSTFQILSLYFSCCHGDRWAHHRYYHNKSNSSLLCPWELPGSEN